MSMAPFTGLGHIKSYHSHTETSRLKSKARHVRLTVKEDRRRLPTHGAITTWVGVVTLAGLLIWAIMPLQRLFTKPGGVEPTEPLPMSIILVFSVVALSGGLVALYYHLVGKNIGPKIDIRIRPEGEPPEDPRTLYIVQTSLALKEATLDKVPEAYLKTMLEEREEQATLAKVSEAQLKTMRKEREEQKWKSAEEEYRVTRGTA